MIYVVVLVGIIIYYLLIYYFMIKPNQKALEKTNKKLKLLYDLSMKFHETITLEDSLEQILKQLIDIVNADAASLFLLDEKREFFYCPVAVGPTAREIVKVKVPYGEGLVSKVEQLKNPLLINDMSLEKNHFKEVDEALNYKTTTMICVPLFVKEKFLGAFQLINKKDGRSFSMEDSDLLGAIASLTSLAVKSACYFKKLNK
ncbi:MAG TPA: GAF domain-containing protein [Candidatus Wallbacteria bacterium]|nr:MAG: fused phosphoenolpyruvate-protein phosphotransferase PtsP/GAF domain protein [bacterium ADurb.Bin243]HOD40722.1 GAF domain-containing protein [Candidatus Wallbacteria bacterium]HPG58214.1 GAF domain-containing protein [Candidatus Wallbacteria bacterium]